MTGEYERRQRSAKRDSVEFILKRSLWLRFSVCTDYFPTRSYCYPMVKGEYLLLELFVSEILRWDLFLFSYSRHMSRWNFYNEFMSINSR